MPEIVPTVTETPIIQAEVPIYNEAISVTGLATPAEVVPEVVQAEPTPTLEQNQFAQHALIPPSLIPEENKETPI